MPSGQRVPRALCHRSLSASVSYTVGVEARLAGFARAFGRVMLASATTQRAILYGRLGSVSFWYRTRHEGAGRS